MKRSSQLWVAGGAALLGGVGAYWWLSSGWYVRVSQNGYPTLYIGPSSRAEALETRQLSEDFYWSTTLTRSPASPEVVIHPEQWPELAWRGPDELYDELAFANLEA